MLAVVLVELVLVISMLVAVPVVVTVVVGVLVVLLAVRVVTVVLVTVAVDTVVLLPSAAVSMHKTCPAIPYQLPRVISPIVACTNQLPGGCPPCRSKK
jgi:hypothetical protein